jgi:S1-C subfamily serine protease
MERAGLMSSRAAQQQQPSIGAVARGRSSFSCSTSGRCFRRSLPRFLRGRSVVSFSSSSSSSRVNCRDDYDDDVLEEEREKATRKKTTRRDAVLVGGTSFICLLCEQREQSEADPVPQPERFVSAPTQLSEKEKQITEAFARASKACVNIVDVTLLSQSGVQKAQAGAIVPEGNGSGIVWDSENGYIVTNYHVVSSAISAIPKGREIGEVAKVTVELPNGQSKVYPGELVGYAKSKDIAVLKINCERGVLTPIQFGASAEQIKVGQIALAIGNPFGFDHTLTTGIISGKNRSVETFPGSFVSGALQTDAAINPGNSGGPLVSADGKLIGVNAAIFTNTGQNVGVGFAIPVDVAKRVADQLIQNSKRGNIDDGSAVLDFPSLNIVFADDAVKKALNKNDAPGVLIQGFIAGKEQTNAEKAGLLPTRRGLGGITAGDFIVKFNDKPVSTEAELVALVEKENVGDTARVTVFRNNNNNGGGGGDNNDAEKVIQVVLERARV